MAYLRNLTNPLCTDKENYMGKVVGGATISLDGFINDRYGDLSPLYPDLAELRKTEFLQESILKTGAAVMGRHAYHIGNGDFTDYEYQVPIFVLTHHIPDKVTRGQNEKLKFHFVTDGIKSAVRQAKAAAGDKTVQVIGGASTFQQCLDAGLLDEIEIGVVPLILGEGLRLFAQMDKKIELEKIRILESPG